ncbi:collagen alpha-1(XII) chain isoform X3 [Nematostella vectensis]|uniref:collagen alpha-1(XII) chain isoform X3 n=1 Tax=Nematostella vectensis TaxID=45351 RepID=UPI00207758F8|nr:collagen alpha-1(XII) chain isoform X3 [Nematostella vectensis]
MMFLGLSIVLLVIATCVNSDAQVGHTSGITHLHHVIKNQNTNLHVTPTPAKKGDTSPTMKKSEKPKSEDDNSLLDKEPSLDDNGPEAAGRMTDWSPYEDTPEDQEQNTNSTENNVIKEDVIGPTNAPSDDNDAYPTMPPDEEPKDKHKSAAPTPMASKEGPTRSVKAAPTPMALKEGPTRSVKGDAAVLPVQPTAAPTPMAFKEGPTRSMNVPIVPQDGMTLSPTPAPADVKGPPSPSAGPTKPPRSVNQSADATSSTPTMPQAVMPVSEEPTQAPVDGKDGMPKMGLAQKRKLLEKTSKQGRTQPVGRVLGKVCKARVDLAFLLDGSDGIGKDHFQDALSFVKNVINSFDVTPGNVHVAMAVCSDKPHIVFDFRAFNDHVSISRALGSVKYPQGKLMAGRCLRAIKSSIFINSGRHGVPKMLYVMTGGNSRDRVALPSRSLRDDGVQVYSLGLGNSYKAYELKEMATSPFNDHVMATRFNILGLLRPLVTAQLCRGSGGKLVKDKEKVKSEHPLYQAATNHDNSRVIVHPDDKKTEKIIPRVTPTKKAEKPRDVSVGLVSNVNQFFKNKIARRKPSGKTDSRKRAMLKADIRRKLHLLLEKLNGKFPDENAIYRSIVYNVNGHIGDATCKDKHKLCSDWKADGLCSSSAKDGTMDAFSVQAVCPRSCNVCYP